MPTRDRGSLELRSEPALAAPLIVAERIVTIRFAAQRCNENRICDFLNPCRFAHPRCRCARPLPCRFIERDYVQDIVRATHERWSSIKRERALASVQSLAH